MNMYDVANRFANLNDTESIEVTTDVTMRTIIKVDSYLNNLRVVFYFQTSNENTIFLAPVEKKKYTATSQTNRVSSEKSLLTTGDIDGLFEINKIETSIDAILTATLSVYAGNTSKTMRTCLYLDTTEINYEYSAIIEKEICGVKLPMRLYDIVTLFDIDPKKDEWIETNHEVYFW